MLNLFTSISNSVINFFYFKKPEKLDFFTELSNYIQKTNTTLDEIVILGLEQKNIKQISLTPNDFTKIINPITINQLKFNERNINHLLKKINSLTDKDCFSSDELSFIFSANEQIEHEIKENIFSNKNQIIEIKIKLQELTKKAKHFIHESTYAKVGNQTAVKGLLLSKGIATVDSMIQHKDHLDPCIQSRQKVFVNSQHPIIFKKSTKKAEEEEDWISSLVEILGGIKEFTPKIKMQKLDLQRFGIEKFTKEKTRGYAIQAKEGAYSLSFIPSEKLKNLICLNQLFNHLISGLDLKDQLFFNEFKKAENFSQAPQEIWICPDIQKSNQAIEKWERFQWSLTFKGVVYQTTFKNIQTFILSLTQPDLTSIKIQPLYSKDCEDFNSEEFSSSFIIKSIQEMKWKLVISEVGIKRQEVKRFNPDHYYIESHYEEYSSDLSMTIIENQKIIKKKFLEIKSLMDQKKPFSLPSDSPSSLFYLYGAMAIQANILYDQCFSYLFTIKTKTEEKNCIFFELEEIDQEFEILSIIEATSHQKVPLQTSDILRAIKIKRLYKQCQTASFHVFLSTLDNKKAKREIKTFSEIKDLIEKKELFTLFKVYDPTSKVLNINISDIYGAVAIEAKRIYDECLSSHFLVSSNNSEKILHFSEIEPLIIKDSSIKISQAYDSNDKPIQLTQMDLERAVQIKNQRIYNQCLEYSFKITINTKQKEVDFEELQDLVNAGQRLKIQEIRDFYSEVIHLDSSDIEKAIQAFRDTSVPFTPIDKIAIKPFIPGMRLLDSFSSENFHPLLNILMQSLTPESDAAICTSGLLQMLDLHSQNVGISLCPQEKLKSYEQQFPEYLESTYSYQLESGEIYQGNFKNLLAHYQEKLINEKTIIIDEIKNQFCRPLEEDPILENMLKDLDPDTYFKHFMEYLNYTFVYKLNEKINGELNEQATKKFIKEKQFIDLLKDYQNGLITSETEIQFKNKSKNSNNLVSQQHFIRKLSDDKKLENLLKSKWVINLFDHDRVLAESRFLQVCFYQNQLNFMIPLRSCFLDLPFKDKILIKEALDLLHLQIEKDELIQAWMQNQDAPIRKRLSPEKNQELDIILKGLLENFDLSERIKRDNNISWAKLKEEFTDELAIKAPELWSFLEKNLKTPYFTSMQNRKQILLNLFPRLTFKQQEALMGRMNSRKDYLKTYERLKNLKNESELEEACEQFLKVAPLGTIEYQENLLKFEEAKKAHPNEKLPLLLSFKESLLEKWAPTYFNLMCTMYPLLKDAYQITEYASKPKKDALSAGKRIGLYTENLKDVIDVVLKESKDITSSFEDNSKLLENSSFKKQYEISSYFYQLATQFQAKVDRIQNPSFFGSFER
jgi:hypothetical protein